MEKQDNGDKKHPINYFLDGDLKTTYEKVLTANQILQLNGIDPQTHYLKWITGATTHSYQNKGEEPIHMHHDMKFISVYNGPMTVS